MILGYIYIYIIHNLYLRILTYHYWFEFSIVLSKWSCLSIVSYQSKACWFLLVVKIAISSTNIVVSLGRNISCVEQIKYSAQYIFPICYRFYIMHDSKLSFKSNKIKKCAPSTAIVLVISWVVLYVKFYQKLGQRLEILHSNTIQSSAPC